MRTLVISDLHLGQHGGPSVLERPRPLECLLEQLPQYDRLVLLGDVVELQNSHSSWSFPLAEPVLRALASALGPEKPIIFTPGNHDHAFLREWSAERGGQLEREHVVPHDASPLLSQMLSWLEPERVEVRYPGVWLNDRVWASHGHHLNHFLRPVSSIGVLDPRHRQRPAKRLAPADFEYLIESPAKPHLRDGLPPQRWHDQLVPATLAPLMGTVLARQMRRHSLPAFAQTAHALGVEAEFVLFGHVHRLGPMPRDRDRDWRGVDGSQRLLNTGSWRFEPKISHGTRSSNPYWPGGAIVIEDDGGPHAVNLLERLSESDIR